MKEPKELTEQFQMMYLKTYHDLVLALEASGGNSKGILSDLRKMSVHELIDIMSKNKITFKIYK